MKMNKKIFIIIPKYKIGGAEKVMIALADELARYNLKIFFITLTKTKNIQFKNKINLIRLNSNRSITSVFKLTKLINKIKPQICLSTISHTNIILFFALKISHHKCNFFLRESNNIFESINNLNKIKKFFYLRLLKFCYKRSNLLSPSKNLSKEIKKKFSIINKVFYIPNPIISKKVITKKKKKFDFINIASLTTQKDHFTILKALKIAAAIDKKLKLIIVGEGILKKNILKFIRVNKLEQNIILKKFSNNFEVYLNQSKVFILSSKFEGYPNVLLDAVNYSLPIVSSNCKFGPSEILQNGKYGRLFKVGDYKELSKVLLNYKKLKIIPKKFLRRNSIKNIGKEYYDLFFKKINE